MMAKFVDDNYWVNRAHEEAVENRKLKCQQGKGPCVMFALDTSGSMAGEAFQQMKTSFINIINEYAKNNMDETVAVVTFGEEVKFRHYYSNNYQSLKRCLGYTTGIGMFRVVAKLVLITDGKPTTSNMIGGEDDEDLMDPVETRKSLMNLIGDIGRGIPFNCIPVGEDPDFCLLGSIAYTSRGGKLIQPKQARQYGRFHVNMRKAAEVLQNIRKDDFSHEDLEQAMTSTGIINQLTEADTDDVLEIINERGTYKRRHEIDDEEDDDDENCDFNPEMLPIVTRVRRGPDWKWGDQDCHGPGTVVNHNDNGTRGWLRVEWDVGSSYSYRYGSNGLFENFDLVECEEPRILHNDLIAVGCLVERGDDWSWGDQDGGKGNIGVVYKVKRNAIVYDTETAMYENMWRSQAKLEAGKQRSGRHQRGRGSCVLLILDCSESMRGEPLREMKRGVFAILDEFYQHPGMGENVSVIVMGNETKFLQYYSNQYLPIKQHIEEVECGGPSPLTAAFILALGGLLEGAAHTNKVGDFLLYPRVVLFTDGRITDFTDPCATDSDTDLIPNERMLAPFFAVLHRIGADHPIFCFPVGKNPNYALLQTISGVSKGGKVLEIYEAKCFGRYTLHYLSANLICKVTNEDEIERENLRSVGESALQWQTYDEESVRVWQTYGEDDLDAIYELIRNKARIIQTQQRSEDDEDRWYKEKFSTIPRLGTRVRRGPHWRFQNQDSEGIGTIVGHGDKAGLVLVEWDNGKRSMYNYGIRDMYDVVVCEEPRIPLDGLVAVGCFVKRGPDWKWEEQDGGEEAIGTCYRVMDNATVYIRWPCGRMGNYRFGYDGKYDIELCDPFSPEVIKAVIEQQNASNRSGTITEHMVASNDLKDNSVIKETPHNTTKQSDCIMQQDKENLTWRSKTSNQGQSTVFQEAADAKSTKTLHEPILQRGQRDCNDRTYTTDKQTEHSCIAVSVEDLETDEGQDTGLECNSVGGITKSFDHINRSSSPDEYQNPLTVNSSVIVNNCDHFKVKPSINTSTNIHKNPEFCVAGTKRDTVQMGTNTEMVTNTALISKHHLTNNSVSSYNSHVRPCLSWQWQDNNGVWVDYPNHVINLINYRLRQHPMATVLISYNDESFRIVASKMIQINTKTKERHNIRCRRI